MHKLAVAFFYTCAVVSITFAALVFIGKASAHVGASGAGLHAGAHALS
jgi:hypothetical protein